MASTNTENQRRFKERMQQAGLKQKTIWVKDEPEKKEPVINQDKFIERMTKLTSGWKKANLSKLFNLFLGIIKAKKEAARMRGEL